jgi:lysophospholipase L1-like esterase
MIRSVSITAISMVVFLLFAVSCGSQEAVKLVAIGDSSTMGIQDAGLVEDYQLNSYPYLIAQKLGIADEFEQPLVNTPGIGVPPYERPLRLEGGEIIPSYLARTDFLYIYSIVQPRLANLQLPRPYDNLAVNGARLYDIRHTTSLSNSVAPGNFFFDIVLRNLQISTAPSFNDTTVLQQAVQLRPTMILLWIGSNDVLGALLGGGDDTLITDTDDFTDEYQRLLNDLTSQTDAVIFTANIPQYVPYGFALDSTFVQDIPMVFDFKTLSPIDFMADLGSAVPVHVPLLVEEADAAHLLLSAAITYVEEGTGIPGVDDLQNQPYNYSPSDAQVIHDAMTASGLKTDGPGTGLPIGEEHSITGTEEQRMFDAVRSFNSVISDLALRLDIPLVDLNRLYDPDQPGAFGGYSGEFVLHDPVDTIFSLDGVHINNLGHAIIANAFIDAINLELSTTVERVDPEKYRGQYEGLVLDSPGTTIEALKGIQYIHR